jgi:hypothetical protein
MPVKQGIDQGSRPDLQGGGLVRSAGGNKASLLGRKKEERQKGDARILGSGDFVEELIEIVAGKLGLKPELICSENRQRQYSEARSLFAWLAVEEVGHPAAEVASSYKRIRIKRGSGVVGIISLQSCQRPPLQNSSMVRIPPNLLQERLQAQQGTCAL